MNRSAKLGLFLTVAAGAATVFGGWAMAQRVGRFHEQSAFQSWHFEENDSRRIEFAGRVLTITDAALPDGRSAVELKYGDKSLLLPVRRPPLPNFADLSVYDEWLQPLFFAPIVRGEPTVSAGGEGLRCVVVARTTGDLDPETWGSADVKHWLFDMYELTRDGDIDHHTMQFRVKKYGTNKMVLPAAEADPATKVEPIEERSWQWQAALFAVPKLQVARYRFGSDAVEGNSTIEGMGWTLPFTSTAVLALLAGVGLMLSSRVGAASRVSSP